jgi:omega-6 fatty acid desaturase (delta-12 desaturase)
LDGKQLVLETKRFAIEERARSWWNLAATVGLIAVGLSVACMEITWGLRLVASVLAGFALVRIFVIFHDYLHGTIFDGSRVARVLFKSVGLMMLSPESVWRHTHDHHHRNNCRQMGTESVGSYPMMTTHAYREASRGTRFFYALQRHPLNMAVAYITVFFYSLTLRPALADPKHHKDAILAVILHLSLVIALAILRPDVLLFAVVIPWSIASGLGAYLFYAQHNYPGVKLRPGEDWDYVEAALRSSSYTKMNPVMRWFTGNIGYHHIHHLNARIPFYRLPEAMAAIEALQAPVTTSLWPSDIIRCLRLNLWDPQKDRLVSFAEARRAATESSELSFS